MVQEKLRRIVVARSHPEDDQRYWEFKAFDQNRTPLGGHVAYIPFQPDDVIPPEDRVPDRDNIIRVHSVHSRVMRQHYDLYLELMRGQGPLEPRQREMIGVVVSAVNACHY